jgi:hemoglobin/transferrin/lactoferrin receptor protein
MKNYIALLLITIMSGGTGMSQVIQVLDKSDLQPIGHVNITNREKSHAVVTNDKGYADLSVFAEKDTLLFSHVAYSTSRETKAGIRALRGLLYMTENIIRLDEIVFTANKTMEKKSDLPYKMEVIQAKDISFNNPSTSAVMLEQTGNVFVQQSQLGGGSPVLRGFEANKILLVVDGIRLNNAIYRAGHLQNSLTVDPNSLSSTEILYGPGSTIYGSDALGGVISFITLDPTLSTDGKTLVSGNIFGRFASANIEKTGGFGLNAGWKKLGVLLDFSYSDFDDLREGKVRNPAYGDFGERKFYAQRINDTDYMVSNSKPWKQLPSGYSQYNVLGKVLLKPNARSKYMLNVQYSTSSNIPRYDRLTEMNPDTTLVYSEWYYGPQSRLLASIKAEYDVSSVIADHASVIAGYQNVHEDRISRKFGSNNKKFQQEQVGVFTVNADLDKKVTVKDNLRYGIEFDYNNVHSKAHTENIITGIQLNNTGTRYPDEKANMMTVAAYLSNNWNINKFLAFSQGLRFSYVTLDAAYSDTMVSILKIPFDPDIKQRNAALNGYLGLVATPGYDWKFSLVGSSGFRAPNIDDLTKLNVVNGQSIVVPNPDLKPEYTYNLEVSVAKTIVNKVRLEGTAFYNWLRDAQVISPYQYNGRDSMMIDGEMYQTLAPTNAGKAYICGLQGSLLAQVTRSFSILSNLTYTYGYDVSGSAPLDHIPPVFGMTSFQLEVKKFKGSFYVMYNGWKRISQYSPSGEDNEVYATPYGMPSWYTLNLKGSYQVFRSFNVELGIENILDENYRKFASGISSPGRNIIVAVRWTF